MRKLHVVWVLAVLSGCGGKSTDDWVRQLRGGDASQRLHAIRALGDREPEAAVVVPALAEALRDDNPYVRRDAAIALGKIGPGAGAAAPALRAARKDRERGVRKAAEEALRRVDPGPPHGTAGR